MFCYTDGMAKKRLNRGFTIVEIATVIFIIAILATITLVVYNSVQNQSRDTKRENDVTTLGSLLNTYYLKNGSYPTGCGDTTCPSGSSFGYQAPDIISVATTLSQLSTALGTSSLGTIDPLIPNSQTPFIGQYYVISNASPGYVYRGGQSMSPPYDGHTGSLGLFKLTEQTSSRYCTVTVYLTDTLGKDMASYVLAYYSQADHVWELYMGSYGVRPVIDSGSTTGFCVVNN